MDRETRYYDVVVGIAQMCNNQRIGYPEVEVYAKKFFGIAGRELDLIKLRKAYRDFMKVPEQEGIGREAE